MSKVPYDLTYSFHVRTREKLRNMLRDMNRAGWNIHAFKIKSILHAHDNSSGGTLLEFREEDKWWNATHFQRVSCQNFGNMHTAEFNTIIKEICDRRVQHPDDRAELDRSDVQRRLSALERRLDALAIFTKAKLEETSI